MEKGLHNLREESGEQSCPATVQASPSRSSGVNLASMCADCAGCIRHTGS